MITPEQHAEIRRLYYGEHWKVGTIAAATSKEVFQTADGKSRNFTSLLRRIGEEGDFTSDIRESLVSLSRLTAFYTAVLDLDRKTEGRKVQRSHLKTLQRDLSSLTDHASFLSDKISFILDATLGLFGLGHHFGDQIYSADGWDRGKPHPDIYLAAAKGLGVDPARCLAIEDSPTGAQAALAAGMTVIGFCGAGHIVDRAAHGAMLRGVGVHHIAHSYDEVLLVA